MPILPLTISAAHAGITLTTGNSPVSVTNTGTISGSTTSSGIYGPGGTGSTWALYNAGQITSTNYDGIQFGAGSKTVSPGVILIIIWRRILRINWREPTPETVPRRALSCRPLSAPPPLALSDPCR
jgi:hypothetical protein